MKTRARLIAMAILGSVAVSTTPSLAADRTAATPPASQRADNSIHALDLTPAQVEQARIERDAARAARAKRTEADKRALAASKQGTVSAMTKSAPDNDIRALEPSPAQRAALKTQRETDRAERAARTPAEKKAQSVEKRNGLYEVARSAPGS
jgi:hypothetical protein